MPFDLQPILKGDLVDLLPLAPEDFDALYAVAADPLIWEQHPAHDRHEVTVFQGFFRDALASGGALLVLDARTGDVIGSSRYHGYDSSRREIEIGWTFLARSCWGGATNGELKNSCSVMPFVLWTAWSFWLVLTISAHKGPWKRSGGFAGDHDRMAKVGSVMSMP